VTDLPTGPPTTADEFGLEEAKYTKSLSNSRTQNAALRVLLTDRRFQALDAPTKKHLVSRLALPEGARYGVRSFDAVMTSVPRPPITIANIESVFGELRLVEMKSTRDPIADEALNGVFFGATENEYSMAELLGPKYLFAFVVLSRTNRFGHPFAVLLTLEEVRARTKVERIQFQVNFRRDIDPVAAPSEAIIVADFADLGELAALLGPTRAQPER
jgi:hypothetical protein